MRKVTNDGSSFEGFLGAGRRGRSHEVAGAEALARDTALSARAGDWLRENADALAAANTYVEEQGLPLARHRKF